MITDEMVEKARHAMIGDGLEAIHKLKLTINEQREMARAALTAALPLLRGAVVGAGKFKVGDRVTKTKGSSWTGLVVGFYSTTLTPEGYAVESETEKGSVQIYPAAALALSPREAGE